MTTAARRSPADRDRAVARLRALTLGTSLASLVAVGGFGALAALSYDGTSGDIVTAVAVTTDNATTTAGISTTGTSTTTDTTTTTNAGATTGTASVQATAAPTVATGTAHAATGSS
jgi:hypothetical protein